MACPAVALARSISISFKTVIGSEAGAVKYHTCFPSRLVLLKKSVTSFPGLSDEALRSVKSELFSQFGRALVDVRWDNK